MTDPLTAHVVGRGLVEVVAAAFLASLAVASVALYGLRRRSADVTSLAFAAFALLYAVRLASSTDLVPFALGGSDALWEHLRRGLTYVILPAGTWFARALLGRGWRGTLQWLHVVASVFAAAAVAGMLLSAEPKWAMPVNNVLVLALLGAIALTAGRTAAARIPPLRAVRMGVLAALVFSVAENLRSVGLLRWPDGIEFIGITAFVASLAFAVADRFLATEGRLAAVDRELATARRIQQRILPEAVPNLNRFHITVRYLPMTEVAGDFYDFTGVDDRGATMLVADVSGHGVPAALIASMVKIATASARDAAGDPGVLLSSLSQSLDGQLGGQLVTAMCVHLDDAASEIAWSGAGHPPLLHWRAGAQGLTALSSDGMLLGVTPSSYVARRVTVTTGDRLLAYTDGVLEVANQAGELFGDGRFHAIVAAHASRSGADLSDVILREMQTWSGRPGFDDDVTLVVIEVT